MTTPTSQPTAAQNAPTHIAYHVPESQRRGQKARWNRIGAFFAHEDGEGGTLILDSLPIAFDGRIVLRTPKADA
jgi:hypothetical protein